MFDLLAFLSLAIFMVFAVISIISISKKKLRNGVVYSVLPIAFGLFFIFAVLDVENIRSGKQDTITNQKVVRSSTQSINNSVVEKSNITDNTTANNALDSKTNLGVQQQQQNSGTMVWITATGDCYHSTNNCGNTDTSKATQLSLEKAKQSYKACDKCHPPQ